MNAPPSIREKVLSLVRENFELVSPSTIVAAIESYERDLAFYGKRPTVAEWQDKLAEVEGLRAEVERLETENLRLLESDAKRHDSMKNVAHFMDALVQVAFDGDPNIANYDWSNVLDQVNGMRHLLRCDHGEPTGEYFKFLPIEIGNDEPGRCICGRGPGGPEWGGAGTCIHCNRAGRDLDAAVDDLIFAREGGLPGQRVINPDTGKTRLCKVCGKPARPIGGYAHCSWACVDAPAVPAPEGMTWDDAEVVTKLVRKDWSEVARIYITVLTRTANAMNIGGFLMYPKRDVTVAGAKRAVVAFIDAQRAAPHEVPEVDGFHVCEPLLGHKEAAEALDVERIVTAAFNAAGDAAAPLPSTRNWVARAIAAGISEYARQTRKEPTP